MNLVINSQFRPFTYDEMIKPLAQYKEVYDKMEQEYAAMSVATERLRNRLNQDNDSRAYSIYNNYSNQLKDIVDDFSKGLNPRNRSALLGMKRSYASDIVPIDEAIKRRDELANEQRKASAQNPTMLYQRKASEMSIDDFLENPSLDYGAQYSGALLTQQVSSAAASLAKELSAYGNGKRLDAFTKTFLQQHGFSRNQVLDAISNPNRATSQPVLNAIVEQVMSSSGILNWNNKLAEEAAYNYARQGLWSAVGQSNISTYEDKGAVLAAQEAAQRRAAATTSPPSNTPKGPAVSFDTMAFGRTLKTEDRERYMKALMLGRRNKNGERLVDKYTITDRVGGANPLPGEGNYRRGAKEVKTQYSLYRDDQVMMTRHQFVNQGKTPKHKEQLANYYDKQVIPALLELGLQVKKDGSYGGGKAYRTGKIIANVDNLEQQGSGAVKTRALQMNFGDSNSTVFNTNIAPIIDKLPDSKISEITGINEDGSFKTKQSKSAKDLKKAIKDGATLSYHLSTSAGKQGLIITVDGVDYFIDKGRFGSASRNAWDALAKADKASNSYETGKLRLRGEIDKSYKAEGVTLTKEQLDELTDYYASTDPTLQQLNDIITDYGSKYTSEQGFGIFGKYSVPSVKLVNESD